MDRIIRRILGLEEQPHKPHGEFLRRLRFANTPQACIISCCDASVAPHELCKCSDADLLVVRNIGNIVPTANPVPCSELAAIEYAVTLGVREFIVCGHSECHALRSLIDGGFDGGSMDGWLEQARAVREVVRSRHGQLCESERLLEAVKANVLVQSDRLRSIPMIDQLLREDAIRVHSWVYRQDADELLSFDGDWGRYRSLALAPRAYL